MLSCHHLTHKTCYDFFCQSPDVSYDFSYAVAHFACELTKYKTFCGLPSQFLQIFYPAGFVYTIIPLSVDG